MCLLSKMTQSSEQIDPRFQKFSKIFNEILKQNEQCKIVIETLNADLESCRSTRDFFKSEILEKLGNDSHTVQYTRLLAKIADLETEIVRQREHQQKLQEVSQEERQRLLAELEKERNAHVETELKLTNDLQLANNIAAIQYDELELKMQARLATVTTQLKESNNICHMLRAELFSLKQRLSDNTSEEKIRRLEEKLRFTEERLKNAEEQIRNGEGENVGPSKYNPVKIISFENREQSVSPVTFNQCHVTNKQVRNIQANTRSGFPIPPLKELNKQNSKTVPKKRKLFNPDDYHYLGEKNQEQLFEK